MNTFLNICEERGIYTYLEFEAKKMETQRGTLEQRIFNRGLYEQFRAFFYDLPEFNKRKAKKFNRPLLEKFIYKSEEL